MLIKHNLLLIVLTEGVLYIVDRFGKTLNMSMFYYSFSNKKSENAYLFDGLKVTKYLGVMKYQNQYPTISISLKCMKNKSYSKQIKRFKIQ